MHDLNEQKRREGYQRSLDERLREIVQHNQKQREEFEKRMEETNRQFNQQLQERQRQDKERMQQGQGHQDNRQDLYLVNNGRHDGWCHAYDKDGQLQTRYDIEKGVVPREFAKGEDGQYHERIERHSPTMSMVPPGYKGREAYTYHEYQNVNDQYKMHDARLHERSPEIDRYHTQQMQQSQAQDQNQPWYIQDQTGEKVGGRMWSMQHEREMEMARTNRDAMLKQWEAGGRNPMEELKKQIEQGNRQAQGEMRKDQNKQHIPVQEAQQQIRERSRTQSQEHMQEHQMTR